MKKIKNRIGLYLMSVITMVFALSLFIGGEAKAANPLEYYRDSELVNPISQIEFIPQDDGTFQMDLGTQFYIYPNGALENRSKVDTANYKITDKDGKVIAEGQADANLEYLGVTIISSVCQERNLNPGETIRIYMDMACSSINQGQKPTELTVKGEKAEFKAIEVKVPAITDLMWVKSLKVSSSGIRKVDLKWSKGTIAAYVAKKPVEGYRVCRYNEAGTKVISTKYYTKTSCTISLPTYSGEYKVSVQPYITLNGKKVYGKSETLKVKSAQVKAPKASITKISNTKVKIKITKGSYATGTIIYQKVNGSWKKLGSTTGTSYTVTKNTAGKRTYKFKSYVKYDGNTYYSTYSSVYEAKSNIKYYDPWYKYGLDEYDGYVHKWQPEKIYYSDGKVKVKGGFINTHNYKLSHFKIKLTVKCNGVVIGTKTYDAGSIKKNSVKVVTLTLDKSKTGYDLRNGDIKVSYSVIKASK